MIAGPRHSLRVIATGTSWAAHGVHRGAAGVTGASGSVLHFERSLRALNYLAESGG